MQCTKKAWFPGSGHSTQKRTLKGPKRTFKGYIRTFSLLYWRRFYATYWLSKLKRKWWSNSIIVACVCINWRLWAHIYNTKMVGFPWLQHGGCIVCFSHITICGTAAKIQLHARKILLLGALTVKGCSQMDFKAPHNNGKDNLTNRKDSRAESKDWKGLFIQKSISKELKGPKRTLGTLGQNKDKNKPIFPLS